MFGYVRAVTSVLSPEDAQRYEAVYCGLCRTLGNRYGKTAQLILNYDFVFLALLRPSRRGGTFPCCPCPVHPWRKKTCWLGSPALDEAADATVILTWWKPKTPSGDGGLWERGEEPGSCPGPAPPLPHRRRPPPCLRPHRPNLFGGAAPAGGGQHPLLGPAGGHLCPHPPGSQRRDRLGRPDPWGGADPLPCGPVDLPGRRLGRPGPRPKGGELQPPPGPVRRPGGDGGGPPPGNHARLPGPGQNRFFLCWTGASGKGCWGTSYPPACRRWRRQCYRPVEREKPSLSPSSRAALPADPRDKENNSL